MKKNQIKFVGVCAATLLTVGALAPMAPTVAHAEGEISTLALTNTQNNLKANVDMPLADYYNGFEKVLAELTPLNTDVSKKQVSNPAWSALWNQPTGTDKDFVSYNVGLQDVDLNLDGSFNKVPGNRKAISQIFIKTDWLNTKEYVAGDTIKLDFWGADESNNLVGNAPLASTTVKLVGVVQDYSATGQDVNATIGDTFNLDQNVTLKNAKTGKALTYIEYDLAKTNVQANGNITIDGKTYPQGTWYSMLDVTSKDGKTDAFNDAASSKADNEKRVKKETNVGNKTVSYKYNKPITFNQTLKAFVYSSNGTWTDGNVYYINRAIKVVDQKAVNPVPVYRAYNVNDGDHLFTTNQSEYNNVVAVGWSAENVAWNAASSTADNGFIVYRLYNPNSGEHFYTSSKAEYMNLGSAGWKQEGLGFNSPKAEGNVAVYRAFNPNAKGPGSHMFTTSKVEYNNMVKAGWTGENIAFYGLAD